MEFSIVEALVEKWTIAGAFAFAWWVERRDRIEKEKAATAKTAEQAERLTRLAKALENLNETVKSE